MHVECPFADTPLASRIIIGLEWGRTTATDVPRLTLYIVNFKIVI